MPAFSPLRMPAAVVTLTTACLAVTACGDDDTLPDVEPLPGPAQILPDPDSQDGTILFELTTAGDSDEANVVFVNGGRQDLVVSNVSITGDDADAFEVVERVPEGDIETRGAFVLRMRFNPAERGYHLATLVVRSNADNFPELTLDLIGPATASPRPAEPDIVLLGEAERSLDIGGDETIVRYVNLGGRSLLVSAYELVEVSSEPTPTATATPTPTESATPTATVTPTPPGPEHFRLAAGTANPGAACAMASDCNGGLECTEAGVCASLPVPAGLPVAFQVRFEPGTQSSYEGTLTIVSDDPDAPRTTVTLTAP